MIDMPPGVTPAKEGFGNVVWNILGQTYTLKQHSEASMAWHAVFPDGTFVPPHIHPTQDEFIYVLSGRYDLWLDGKDSTPRPATSSACPRASRTASSTSRGETATSLFWVAPTRSLKELFERIHNLPDPQRWCDVPPNMRSTSCRRLPDAAPIPPTRKPREPMMTTLTTTWTTISESPTAIG